ncbi:hypothetical protein [Senegalia massiliensis]|uniref:Uncharacterized protein n=1 Tax=Senegalia massiliensis TaxID=1720316 RepID=A0A845R1F7_9CLOT|nr:hypothetical protein [Senegalia massiliensis]NBI07556.1 hypothetical protein [Senegalia massiliensis]
MFNSKYPNKRTNIIRKIAKNEVLDYKEIAFYFNIEEKLVYNILMMYRNYGRENVYSITLTNKRVDEIISLGTKNKLQVIK